jgi:hypothetical protein
MKRLGIHNRNHKYTPEEKQFIKDNVVGRSYADLTCLFNRKFNCSMTISQIRSSLTMNNLRNGRKHTVSKEHLNYKTFPIGSEEVWADGYIRIKVALPNVWKKKQVLIWEQAHGPIPEGHVIMFADRNKSNCDLDNLLLVSLKELAMMMQLGLIFENKEWTKTGKTIAVLKLAIAKRNRELREENKRMAAG